MEISFTKTKYVEENEEKSKENNTRTRRDQPTIKQRNC